MPKTIIRLAAGRHTFSETEQAMVSRGGMHVEAKSHISLFSYWY
jgi:biotin synthase-like enzyme